MTKKFSYLILVVIILPVFLSLSMSSISTNSKLEYSLSSIKDIRHYVNATIYAEYYENHYVFASYIAKVCLDRGIPVHLFMSLIMVESSFKKDAVHKNKNGTYDIGLCQLNTATFKNYTIKQLLNPYNNIWLGAKTLRDLYDYLGSWELAIQAYNAGISRVVKNKTPKSTINYLSKILDFETIMNSNYLGYEQRGDV